MAKKKPNSPQTNIRDIRKQQNELNDELKYSIDLIKKQRGAFNDIFNLRKKALDQEKILVKQEKILYNKQLIYNAAKKSGLNIANQTQSVYKKDINSQRTIISNEQKRLDSTKNLIKSFKKINFLLGSRAWEKTGVWKYLLESDKAIRQTNLELGLSGEKAKHLRQSFYDTATFSARFGVTMKDIATIQRTFTDETGRARVFSSKMLEDIILIGKGTGLGTEKAALLVGQFDLMGINTLETLKLSQDIVDTSERMGVNVTKVISSISKNFKSLQKFTFQQGVRGFAQMATYAEKFKIDMGQMLDSAEKARTLKGAVELAANLQVMGGEFAKTDPFELLFLSRNDPMAYTRKINDMTKGIITWKKNADGTFQKFLAPADRDRLEAVGKILGLQSGELITQALRMADITKMRRQLLGVGVNKEQQQLIEGMAQLNKNGEFTIKVGDEIKSLSTLTSNDLKLLKEQKELLDQRAIDSQTFSDTLKITGDLLKTALIPMLEGINTVLKPMVYIANKFKELLPGLSSFAGTLFAGAGILMASGVILSSAFRGLTSLKSFIGMGRAKRMGNYGNIYGLNKKTGGGGGGAIGRGAGKAGLATGAGVAIGALGIGGGMFMASKGITSIANAMKGLNKEQLDALKWIAITMPIAMGAGAALLIAFGKAAEASVIGIGILTLAILGIGAGIGIATTGIGLMAKGIATLAEPKIANNLMGVASSMSILMGAMAIGGLTGILGAGGMLATIAGISSIASNADDMERVGGAFQNIAVVMNGNFSQLKEIDNIIKSISSTKIGNNNIFSRLSDLLNKPIKVEFSEKEVAMGVELNIDGSTVFKKIFNTNVSLRNYTDASNGIITST